MTEKDREARRTYDEAFANGLKYASQSAMNDAVDHFEARRDIQAIALRDFSLKLLQYAKDSPQWRTDE